MKRWIIILALLLAPLAAGAEELFMVRTQETFPEAMLRLQDTIGKHGYTVSRVQRVDIGLTKSGYKTDKYRVVFFGKADEVAKISDKYPSLLAYMPLKIAIFAEGDETLLIASDPQLLFANVDPSLKPLVSRWHRDIDAILREMRDQ